MTDSQLSAPRRVVLAGSASAASMHRSRQVGQEAARRRRRLPPRCPTAWSRPPAGYWIPSRPAPASVLLRPQRIHHRRPGDEHRRGLLVMTEKCVAASRAAPSPATEPGPSPTTGTAGEVVADMVVQPGAATAARQVGPPGRLDGLHRAAAARALDDADDRQAEIGRHALRHDRLLADGGVGAAAAHGEVVADHHHRAAIHQAAADDAVGGREFRQLAIPA